jgi:hypothetical protein
MFFDLPENLKFVGAEQRETTITIGSHIAFSRRRNLVLPLATAPQTAIFTVSVMDTS